MSQIVIKPSKTADTRSCDFSQVSKETLYESSVQHIGDVTKGLDFFREMLAAAAVVHDWDKLRDIDGFHRDFVTGFAQTEWWDKHRKVNRHHLLNEDGVPADVNLVDVLDMITDCVMAGMARTGTVYPLNISDKVLADAFRNTVELLKASVRVDAAPPVAAPPLAPEPPKQPPARFPDHVNCDGSYVYIEHDSAGYPHKVRYPVAASASLSSAPPERKERQGERREHDSGCACHREDVVTPEGDCLGDSRSGRDRRQSVGPEEESKC